MTPRDVNRAQTITERFRQASLRASKDPLGVR
jgi:hypothetical protein